MSAARHETLKCAGECRLCHVGRRALNSPVRSLHSPPFLQWQSNLQPLAGDLRSQTISQRSPV